MYLVLLGKDAVSSCSGDGGNKLVHGVSLVLGQERNGVQHVRADSCSGSGGQVSTNRASLKEINLKQQRKMFFKKKHFFGGGDLGFGGDLSGDEEPQESLWQGLGASGSSGQLLLALGNGQIAIANALFRVEQRGLPDHALHRAHASVRLLHSARPKHRLANTLSNLQIAKHKQLRK